MVASREVLSAPKKKNLHVPAFIIFPYPVFGHTNYRKKVEPLPVADMQWLLCHKSAVE